MPPPSVKIDGLPSAFDQGQQTPFNMIFAGIDDSDQYGYRADVTNAVKDDADNCEGTGLGGANQYTAQLTGAVDGKLTLPGVIDALCPAGTYTLTVTLLAAGGYSYTATQAFQVSGLSQTPIETDTPTPTATNKPAPKATNTHTPVPAATATNPPQQQPAATHTNTPIPKATNTHTPVPAATATNPPPQQQPAATHTNTPIPKCYHIHALRQKSRMRGRQRPRKFQPQQLPSRNAYQHARADGYPIRTLTPVPTRPRQL